MRIKKIYMYIDQILKKITMNMNKYLEFLYAGYLKKKIRFLH